MFLPPDPSQAEPASGCVFWIYRGTPWASWTQRTTRFASERIDNDWIHHLKMTKTTWTNYVAEQEVSNFYLGWGVLMLGFFLWNIHEDEDVLPFAIPGRRWQRHRRTVSSSCACSRKPKHWGAGLDRFGSWLENVGRLKKTFFKGSLFKRHVLFVFLWGGIRWKLKMMISLKFCVCLSQSGLLPWGFSKKPYYPWVLMWEGVEARVFQKQRMTHRLQRNIAGLGMFSLSAFNSCKVTTVAYIYLEIEEVGEARFTGINIPKFALNSSIPHEHAMFFFLDLFNCLAVHFASSIHWSG